MKVCRYEQGNTSLFICPYHSCSYTTDGKPWDPEAPDFMTNLGDAVEITPTIFSAPAA